LAFVAQLQYAFKVFVGKFHLKRPFGGWRFRRENNIEPSHLEKCAKVSKCC
jgi:hypothetical protein